MSHRKATIMRQVDEPWGSVAEEGFSDETGERVSPRDDGMTDDLPSADRSTVTLEEHEGRTRSTKVRGVPWDVAERNGETVP